MTIREILELIKHLSELGFFFLRWAWNSFCDWVLGLDVVTVVIVVLMIWFAAWIEDRVSRKRGKGSLERKTEEKVSGEEKIPASPAVSDGTVQKIKTLLALRSILLLLFRPDRFVGKAVEHDLSLELKRNEQLRAMFPTGQLPPERKQVFERNAQERTENIRKALWGGLRYTVVTVLAAWASGAVIEVTVGLPQPHVTRLLQLLGGAIVLGATLSLLGWEIHSIHGQTLPEQVNRSIYRYLYVIGTYAIALSLTWS